MDDAAAIIAKQRSVEHIAGLLAPLPIFARLDAISLRAVAERCKPVRFHAGDTIMAEGEASAFMRGRTPGGGSSG